MGDRIAYYKNVRLGDFMHGPEALSAEIDRMQFQSGVWANKRVPIERGANAVYGVSLSVAMLRGYYSGGESLRAFQGRKLQFLADMVTATGFGSGNIYSQAGVLAIIEDTATDATTLSGAVAGGQPTVRVSSGAGSLFTAGNVVYLSGSNGGEIVTVESVAGADITFTTNLTYGHETGDFIGIVLWYLPSAYCTELPTIEGVTAGTASVARNMSIAFSGADDPVEAA